jgi:hypothetical protein
MIIAAILHLNEGPRALPRAWQRLACERFKVECFLREIQQLGDQPIFATILDYALHIW